MDLCFLQRDEEKKQAKRDRVARSRGRERSRDREKEKERAKDKDSDGQSSQDSLRREREGKIKITTKRSFQKPKAQVRSMHGGMRRGEGGHSSVRSGPQSEL